MNPGALVVINNRLYEVVDFDPNGYVQVVELRHTLESTLEKSLEKLWYDVYVARVIDPTKSGRDLLEAMATISTHEEHVEEAAQEDLEEGPAGEEPPVQTGGAGLVYLQQKRAAG